MDSFLDRMMEEWRELGDKLTKLNAFIDSNMVFLELPEEDQDLLKAQRDAMRAYSGILTMRLKRIYKIKGTPDDI